MLPWVYLTLVSDGAQKVAKSLELFTLSLRSWIHEDQVASYDHDVGSMSQVRYAYVFDNSVHHHFWLK